MNMNMNNIKIINTPSYDFLNINPNPNNNNILNREIILPEYIDTIKEGINSINNINTNSNNIDEIEEADFLGRNSRPPKRANHGARPCSSYMRRKRAKNIFKTGKIRKGDDN